MVEIPQWKSKLHAARLQALEALSPEERAERLHADAEELAARSERRAARSAQDLFINQRAALGDTPQEIAERLGIGVGALRARGRHSGHVLTQRAGYRRLPAWVATRHVRALDAIAADAGMSREKAVEALLAGLLGKGVTIAREMVPRAKPAPVKRQTSPESKSRPAAAAVAPRARAPERIVEPV